MSELGDMKDHLLFIHAWSGCDTTPSIMNKGKSSFFKLVQKSSVLQAASEVMTDYWAEIDDVLEAAIATRSFANMLIPQILL